MVPRPPGPRGVGSAISGVAQPASSSSPPSTSLTLGSFLISTREIFHARWTTHDSDRSSLAPSPLISWSIDSGKYRRCLRLSVFEPGRLAIGSFSLVAKGSLLHVGRRKGAGNAALAFTWIPRSSVDLRGDQAEQGSVRRLQGPGRRRKLLRMGRATF